MRGRGIRILLVLVVVLGGLFVAADRLAVSYAESQAADRLQRSQGLTTRPSVSIKGFPFLTQVAAHDLTEVTATATDVQTTSGTDRLRISRLTADLHDVRVNGNFSSAVADSATGTALVSYADVARQAPKGVTVGYGGTGSDGKGQVRFTGSYRLPVLGTQKATITGHVTVESGDVIRLKADGKPVIMGVRLPIDVERLVRENTDFGGPLSGLPTGITVSGVDATPDGLQISLTGRNVRLAG